MDLLSFLITTGINLLFNEYANGNKNNNPEIIGRRNNDESYFTSIFPLSLLKNSQTCSTVNFIFGENDLKISTIPRGKCLNCCPINLFEDIKFILYNKELPQPVQIHPFNKKGSVKKAGLNPNWKTIIFIHGFCESSSSRSGQEITKAYLSKEENYNVILLDWGNLSSFPWYKTAVNNVKLVGRILRNFIKLFSENNEIFIRNLHIIGFSLGSHIASIAGKSLTGTLRLPKITALDPAYPEFPINDRQKRLSKTDAEYVDVIHTDAGIFGYPISMGHADFYPNGGKSPQPGCQPIYLAQQHVLELIFACSHIRAWIFYAESVRNPKAFPATECPDWNNNNNKENNEKCNFTFDGFMGFGNWNLTGQFYLRTNFKSPFGLNVEEQINNS